MFKPQSLPFQPVESAPPTFSPARRVSRCLPWLASLLLAACASVPQGAPEDLVRQRATERWQALVAGDFAKAYTYATPAFKATVTADVYKARFGKAAWYGAEVVSVTCPEPAQCTAKVRIEFKAAIKGIDRITTHFDETWLLEDGHWWQSEKI